MQMHHMCYLGKISESMREKSERDIQNGDEFDRTDRRHFLFTEKRRKALEIFPGACPVTDRRCSICFIGLIMNLGG